MFYPVQLDVILAQGIALDVKIEHSEASPLTQRKWVARMQATIQIYSTHSLNVHESRPEVTADDALFVMEAPQAESDAESERLQSFGWPRTLFGTMFLHDDGFWVHVESGSMEQDNYDLLHQTIPL